RLRQGLVLNADQTAGFAEARAAAVRTIVIDHDFLQVRLHSFHAAALLAIPMVVPLDLGHDTLERHLFAGVLLALARSFRQDNLNLLSFAPVENEVLHGLRQFGKWSVETESIMLREAVQPAPAPRVFIVVECLLHDGTVPQRAAWVGHKQRRMDALGGAEP